MSSASTPAAAANQPPQSAEGHQGRTGIHPWLGVGALGRPFTPRLARR
ncbi:MULTISPECIES: hypothetical protein [Rhizobium]|nr:MULTISPECIES: hypothetical protein [Rhizobium]MBB4254863.1 hypothetical protein [Rhizobium sp. BK008]UTS93499.1 hypothetical protein NE851_33565 [Rhizobium anhuiense bv. trifolii]